MRDAFYVKIMHKKHKVLPNVLDSTVAFSMFKKCIRKLVQFANDLWFF
jgi:hypothetical protein